MSARTALVLSPDPYLAFLLERHPEGLEVTVGDDQMRVAAAAAAGADVIVCEHDDPRRGELEAVVGSRLVVVAAHGARVTGPRVIQRPLSAEDVLRVIDDTDAQRPGLRDDPIGALDRAYPALLVAAGLFAAVLFTLRGGDLADAAPGLALTAYGVARVRLHHRLLWLVDAVLATAAALAFDGTQGPFVVLALVVAAGLGLRQRPLVAVPLSLAIGVANVAGAAIGSTDTIDPATAAQSVLAVTLVGALAALGTTYARTVEDVGVDRLGQLLHELRELAGSEPDALQVTRVARLALERVCAAADVDRGVLLLADDGGLRVAATHHAGVELGATVEGPGPHLAATAGLTVVSPADLPRSLRTVVPDDGDCTLVTVRRHGNVQGLIVLGGPVPRHRRREVVRTSADAAGAIGNARLFARLHTDTADEQRRRIAGDLHDSTAQVLAHLRLELELLARGGGASGSDLARLARVADRAQQGLRQVIYGLRGSLPDEGLAGALRSYVADLQSQGDTALLFRAAGHQHLGVQRDQEVFRIAQEAISNAVRHAGASLIEVSVDEVPEGLRLTVADDGAGMDVSPTSGQGMGLAQMRHRAERLGAELDIHSSPRGTEVVLTVPFVQPSTGSSPATQRAHRV